MAMSTFEFQYEGKKEYLFKMQQSNQQHKQTINGSFQWLRYRLEQL